MVRRREQWQRKFAENPKREARGGRQGTTKSKPRPNSIYTLYAHRQSEAATAIIVKIYSVIIFSVRSHNAPDMHTNTPASKRSPTKSNIDGIFYHHHHHRRRTRVDAYSCKHACARTWHRSSRALEFSSPASAASLASLASSRCRLLPSSISPICRRPSSRRPSQAAARGLLAATPALAVSAAFRASPGPPGKSRRRTYVRTAGRDRRSMMGGGRLSYPRRKNEQARKNRSKQARSLVPEGRKTKGRRQAGRARARRWNPILLHTHTITAACEKTRSTALPEEVPPAKYIHTHTTAVRRYVAGNISVHGTRFAHTYRTDQTREAANIRPTRPWIDRSTGLRHCACITTKRTRGPRLPAFYTRG